MPSVIVTDISGPIYEGMWNYPPPLNSYLKDFQLRKVEIPFGGEVYTVEVFDNVKAQTGTYLESPAQYRQENRFTVNEKPLAEFYLREGRLLFIPLGALPEKDGKRYVSLEQIRRAEKEPIPEGCAILVGTGYGANWRNRSFFSGSWFFHREAMRYLLDKKPFLIGADSAEWENPKNPEGIFADIYRTDVFILAPCVNLERIRRQRIKLTVFPLHVQNAFICPVRAAVSEEE
jgi:kynurenine formamidase